MNESLNLFDSIANTPQFAASRMILCFVQMDLFEKKIKSYAIGRHVPIQLCPPEYCGSPKDVRAVKAHFTDMFAALLYRRDSIDVHYLDATDKEDVRRVLAHVLDDEVPTDQARFTHIEAKSNAGSPMESAIAPNGAHFYAI